MGVYLRHLFPRGYATASEGLNPRARDIIHLQSPGSVQIQTDCQNCNQTVF